MSKFQKTLLLTAFLFTSFDSFARDSTAIGSHTSIPMYVPTAVEGHGCVGVGALAYTSDGRQLDCRNYVWTSPAADLVSFYSFNITGVGPRYRGMGKVVANRFYGEAICSNSTWCGQTGSNECGADPECVNKSGEYRNNNGRVTLNGIPVYNVTKQAGW